MCATMKPAGRGLALLIGLALTFALSIGCGSKPDGKPKVDKNPAVNSIPGGPGSHSDDTGNIPAPDEFEKKFVQGLADGKATADDLTAGFKKKIAPARPGFDEDQKLGYNPDAVASFLKGKFPTTFEFAARDGAVAYYTETKTPSLLKLVYTPSTGWKVDWLHSTNISAATVDLTSKNHMVTAAARCFLEPLLSGDLMLTEASMSQPWKVRMAGSDNKSDKERGYSQGQLRGYFRLWSKGHRAYEIISATVDGDSGMVKGKFTDGDPEKFTLKVTKDKNGDWLADDLKFDEAS